MTWQGAIILSIIFAIYWFAFHMMAETKRGKKYFRFIMSFFVSAEKFEKTDWNKPVPTWVSTLIWISWLGMLIYSGIKYF